jgi:hypothetical protein
VEYVVQPAGGAAFQRDGPVNHGEAAIEFRREPGKMMALKLRGQRNWSHSGQREAEAGSRQVENGGFLPKAATARRELQAVNSFLAAGRLPLLS